MNEQQPRKRPNIVVMMADDMGFSDIGCYGSEIRTPNLNAMAAGGVRFTQMYNCGRCCPTRASLLTGLYPHQAGVGLMVGDMGRPGYRGFLNDRCVTIAEALKAAGYRTCLSGKWHVGGPYAPNDPETWKLMGDPGHPTPRQRGFDEFFGMLGGAGSYFNPPYMARNDSLIEVGGGDFYLTDAIADEACGMIDRASEGEAPFFLYVAFTAPHWPLHAPREDIERYRGLYEKGWDAVRTARHERLRDDGILSDKWPISPRDEQAPPWSGADNKEWEDLRMAVYAAQVDRMDQGIGRILARLDALDLADDTLVMFLSDNGGCAEFLAEDTDRANPFRYSIPTADGRTIRVGNTPKIDPGPADTFASYDLPWANASNTPFRLYKHWVHEGGVATPLICRWPNGLPGGGMTDAPAHVIDIMASCLDAAGADYPAECDGRAIAPTEGESFLPAARGERETRERPIFFEHHGNCAVRDGQWKLVRQHPGPWELYDMSADRTELNDLSGGEKARLEALTRQYDGWADRCVVVDWDELRGG